MRTKAQVLANMIKKRTNPSLARRVFCVLCVTVFCGRGLNAATTPAPADERPQTVVVEGATLIDGTGRPPVSCSIIVIEGDRIREAGQCGKVRIPKGAKIVDARGKFVVPGLIDCHCHLEAVGLGDLGELSEEWAKPDKLRELILDDARLDLAAGFTTIRDLGSTPSLFEVRKEIESGKFPGPRILAAGQQLVKKASGAYMDPSFLEYDGAEDARKQVRHLVSLGADVIKVRLTSQRPMPSAEELQALTSEAHGLSRRVTAHTDVPANEAVQLAIEGGLDGIEHNAPLRAGQAILQQMGARHMYVDSGVGVIFVQHHDQGDSANLVDESARRVLPKEVVVALEKAAVALQQQTAEIKKRGWKFEEVQARSVRGVQEARQAGVLLGFGTDCGGELLIHGQQYKTLYGETQMGSSPTEALLMATRDAAKILGREKELGTVEPGKLADLVLLDGDPLGDLRNVGKVHAVMKSGKLYGRDELLETQKPSPR